MDTINPLFVKMLCKKNVNPEFNIMVIISIMIIISIMVIISESHRCMVMGGKRWSDTLQFATLIRTTTAARL